MSYNSKRGHPQIKSENVSTIATVLSDSGKKLLLAEYFDTIDDNYSVEINLENKLLPGRVFGKSEEVQ